MAILFFDYIIQASLRCNLILNDSLIYPDLLKRKSRSEERLPHRE
jgi:hypothetical protein